MRFVVLFVLTVLAGSLHGGEARIDQPHRIEDPAYGEILYDYYQQRYFAAMSRILVALETGALPNRRQRARVLLGATYVRYGMPDAAESLFRDVLAESVDPELASRAWLHLAELYYRKQDHERALKILNEQVPPVPDAIAQQYHALHTRTLMKLGRYEETAGALDHFEPDDPLNAYLKYNLAVSRINAGRGGQGEPLLRELINLVPGQREVNAVKDKAILALGQYYLKREELEKARTALGITRLEGPYSDLALLLHAQSWIDGEQPEKALAPLSKLADRSIQHESVQAAMLSRAHLYRRLGNPVRAAEAYRGAIRAYDRHFRSLERLRGEIKGGAWFDKLVTQPAWSTAMEPVPEFEPNTVDSFATFAPLFATHAFQNTWRDYHELLRQLHLIEAWQQRLPSLRDLVRAHERKHEQRVPAARTLLREVERMAPGARYTQLHQRLNRAIENNRYRVFASPDERELLEELDQARKLAARWPDKLDPEKRDKLDFYEGVLAWQIRKDIVPRQWQRRKKLKELEGLLNRNRSLRERVRRAASGDTARLDHYRSEYAELADALERMLQRGQRLLARHRRRIESLALTRLAQTRDRLVQFSAIAWDSLGDIQNEAVRARGQPPEALEDAAPSPGARSSE